MKKQEFKERLDGTFVTDEEYLHRTSYAIGSIVQILETDKEITDKSRRAIYNEISNINKNVGHHCVMNFHRRYREYCKNK